MIFEPKINKSGVYEREMHHLNPDRSAADLTGKDMRITIKGLWTTPLVLATNGAASAHGSTFLFTSQATGIYKLKLTAAENATIVRSTGEWILEMLTGSAVREVGRGLAYARD